MLEFRPMTIIGDGDRYIGQWIKGQEVKQGFGTYIWDDGDYYQGNWLNDNKHFKGKIVRSDGYMYEGDYQNGKAHG